MYKLKLAIRYFLRRRITSLAVAAVALCVFIVVVVMTVMNGLVEEFSGKNHSFAGDCVVSTDSLVGFPYYEEFVAELDKQDFVEASSAVIKSFGLLTQPGADWNIGIEVSGIDPVAHSNVTGFDETLHYHRDDPANAFVPSYAVGMPGCVVGIDMMNTRRDKMGQYYHGPRPQQIELIVSCFPLNTKGGLVKAGTDLVNTVKFFYSDDSHSGLVKVDGKMVYIPFDYAVKLCGMDVNIARVNTIHVKFKEGADLYASSGKVRKMWEEFVAGKKEAEADYANLMDNVAVESWRENRRGTIAPMEKEQTMLTLVFLMLGVITVFVILVIFYMVIGHKSKDIGVLRSIGVPGWGVVEIFVYFAVFIGLIGSLIGVSGGCALLWKVHEFEGWLFETFDYQVWDRSMYAIGEIPNKIEPVLLGVVILSAVCASVLGSLIPSIEAARKKPVEILQVSQV